MSQQATAEERVALVKSIRDLADYVEQHPDLPIESVHAHIRTNYGNEIEQVLHLADQYGFALDQGWLRHKIAPNVHVNLYVNKEKVLVPSIDEGTVSWGLPTAAALKAVA